MKPILLLDVDGVINAFGGIWSDAYEAENFDTHMINGYTIRIPKGTAQRIAILGQHFEMHWGTMWMETAHDSFQEILGLPIEPWPWVDFATAMRHAQLDHSRPETWKLEGVKLYGDAYPDRPMVWVDDDISHEALSWTWDRGIDGARTMALKTDPAVGFTDEHVETLIDFAGASAPA